MMITVRRDFLKRAGLAVGMSASAGLPSGFTQINNGAAKSPSDKLNVRNFGAVGDGTTVDTPAVNRAIDAAAAAGGGTVYFPAGTYLCYSIHLKSKVVLELDIAATILAADVPPEGTTSGGYDAAEENSGDNKFQDYGHSHWHNSLLWAEDQHDFGIMGPGLIYGKGLSRGTRELPRAESPGVGNKAIALKNCRNVILKDFAILKGGHFGILDR